MQDAVIVEAVRTPIGRRGGALKEIRPDELAAHVLRALLERVGIEPKIVDDVVLGCVTQVDEQGLNIGRIAPLVAGFPDSVPGTSVNRMCASGLQAFNFACMEVMTGQVDVVIAGGIESMSRVPLGSDGGALSPNLLERYEIVPQGISADLVADKYGITREQMDEYSLWSHRKASRAIDEGRFRREIVPVPVFDEGGTKRMFDTDEHPRRNTSLEKLASLKPAFKEDGRMPLCQPRPSTWDQTSSPGSESDEIRASAQKLCSSRSGSEESGPEAVRVRSSLNRIRFARARPSLAGACDPGLRTVVVVGRAPRELWRGKPQLVVAFRFHSRLSERRRRVAVFLDFRTFGEVALFLSLVEILLIARRIDPFECERERCRAGEAKRGRSVPS